MTERPLKRLVNKSRKKELAKYAKLCKSVGSKARGLMFTSPSAFENMALIFVFSRPVIRQLHMFFVFYPIDVLFVDGDMKVVEIKERFKPFTVYNPREKSKYIIELPAGVVEKTRTKVGDVIGW